MPDETNTQDNQILSEIQAPQPRNWKAIGSILAVIIVAVVLGAVSAFLFWSQKYPAGSIKSASQQEAKGAAKPPEPQKDEKTFRDKSEGVVEKNDNKSQYNQGTHKLVRPGGPSQTVYLVSSVVDLDQYLDKKVTVWGETFQSNQVGWLMDVGKVEKVE